MPPAVYLPATSPLLDPEASALTMFDPATGAPRRPETYSWYKKIQGLHWVTDEHLDILQEDQGDWVGGEMTKRQKHMARVALGFFLFGDELVIRNLTENMIPLITMTEAQAFYTEQAAQEVTHKEAYGLQVHAVMPTEEASLMEEEAMGNPATAALIDWANAWLGKGAGFWDRLVAFAFYEGVVFSSMFAAIQIFREIGILPGITTFNEFISRDEGLHCDFAVHLITTYGGDHVPSQGRIHAIAAGAVEGAIALGNSALDSGDAASDPIDAYVSKERLANYVRWTANVLLSDLGVAPLYRAVKSNPLPFMEKMELNRVAKTNFFEYRPTQYHGATSSTYAWGTVDESALRV